MRTISLRLPESLHSSVKEIVKEEGVSLNQFVMLALAEKVAALKTQEYLAARARRGSREKFLAALDKTADVEPEDPQDRLTGST